MDSTQQQHQQDEEEEEKPEISEQSQDHCKQNEEEEEVNKQADEMDDIHKEKLNPESVEIATNDQSQSAVKESVSAQEEEEEEEEQQHNIHEQSQEEEEEEENKNVGNNLDISFEREKKNLDGANDRKISRDLRTQRYLDSLIRGNDRNLEDGISEAIRDCFEVTGKYPDADYNSLEVFVDLWLELIDVPPGDLRNLMVIVRRLTKNIQADNRRKLYEKGYMVTASNEIIQVNEEEPNLFSLVMWDPLD